MKTKMKNILKKGLVIMSIYLVFTFYLFLAADRIERLNKNAKLENTGYIINIFK